MTYIELLEECDKLGIQSQQYMKTIKQKDQRIEELEEEVNYLRRSLEYQCELTRKAKGGE